MKIMVVDDSVTMRRIVIMNLKKAGYSDIIEADNGGAALDALAACPAGGLPELILLDWNMPGMNGIELLKNIKASQRLHKIRVIMVTTEAEKEKVMQSLQLGAEGYLVKPITPDNFKRQVIDKFNVDESTARYY